MNITSSVNEGTFKTFSNMHVYNYEETFLSTTMRYFLFAFDCVVFRADDLGLFNVNIMTSV